MKNRTVIIVAGAIVLVAALAGLAMLLSGDDSSDGIIASADTTVPVDQDAIEETRDVILVSGDPLPRLDGAGGVDPVIGTQMPTLEGATFTGEALTIGGAADGPRLYAFLAHWCEFCNQEVPELIELRNRDGVPAGMEVVGISTSAESSAPNYPPSQWFVDMKWPAEWPVMADSDESAAFAFNGGAAYPYLMVVGADGTVLDRSSGVKTAEELAVFLQDALATAP